MKGALLVQATSDK
jgi:hypothetical protein